MSWGFNFAGKPAAVVADVEKTPHLPTGVIGCIKECAAHFPQGEVLVVESSGHFDNRQDGAQKYGGFTLSFKMLKESG